jgi:hypothetical protein
MRHLQEQQVCQLLGVINGGNTIITKQIAKIPQLIDQLTCIRHVRLLSTLSLIDQ